MRARVAIVTGGTSGVGHAFAIAMAQHGATVVLIARSQARAEEACSAIRARVPGADVRFAIADLSSVRETRAAVAGIAETYPEIHVIGTMAGVFAPKSGPTDEGLEVHLATNVVSAWCTICGLRESLLRGAPARVVVLSGNAHLRADFVPDDIGLQRASALTAATRTMLYKVAMVSALSRRVPPEEVTFNAVCPGFTRSGLLRNLPWYLRALGATAGLFAQSPERGARTAVSLATEARYATTTGRYFRHLAERAPNPVAEPASDAVASYLAEVSALDWPVADRQA